MLLPFLLAGCADVGPLLTDRYTVYTPVFADNRVYYLKQRDSRTKTQALEPLGTPVTGDDLKLIIPRNAPLSVILRSVDLPAAKGHDSRGQDEESPITSSADYAVILDIGTAADGSTRSLVVWYQRGVQPDQSLNFSNLLVYYDPRWDERVAPFFRVRVMDVTTERNAETRRALERAHNIGGALGALASNPMISPLLGIAFTAAELVLANRQNRMVIDYSVQLYSSAAAAQAGSGELGVLRRGSYIVVGRPNNEGREFWKNGFVFDPESRVLTASNRRANVPTALVTIGTFESVVPTSVIERSTALTALLVSPTSTTVENVDEAARRLAASVDAYVVGEKLIRYRDHAYANEILRKLSNTQYVASLGSENVFFLIRAMNDCFRPQTPFASLADVETFRKANPSQPCAPRT